MIWKCSESVQRNVYQWKQSKTKAKTKNYWRRMKRHWRTQKYSSPIWGVLCLKHLHEIAREFAHLTKNDVFIQLSSEGLLLEHPRLFVLEQKGLSKRANSKLTIIHLYSRIRFIWSLKWLMKFAVKHRSKTHWILDLIRRDKSIRRDKLDF